MKPAAGGGGGGRGADENGGIFTMVDWMGEFLSPVRG